MKQMIRYFFLDVIRGRILAGYTVLLFLVSFSMYSLEGNATKASLGLMSLVLLAVPLFSIVYGTIHFFNSVEFIELLMAQPLRRTTIILSHYIGLFTAMALATTAGLGIPVVVMDGSATGYYLLLASFFLTAICLSLAYLVSTRVLDKARAMGLAILLWLFFTVIYDGLVLLFLFSFSDYPIEKAMIGLVMFNPIDLARIYILLQLDTSALMGFTGAIFQEFFGPGPGKWVGLVVLAAWASIPLWLAMRIFRRKDM